MPRLCREVSLAFLDGVITELSPEASWAGLEVGLLLGARGRTPQDQTVRSAGPGQAGPQVPAPALEPGTGGPEGAGCGM